MSRLMTKEEAQAWRERWRAVNAFEREETRRKSRELRLQECMELSGWARAMGWLGTRRDGQEQVWERWRRLKEHYARRA
jgi:hypothetical protein